MKTKLYKLWVKYCNALDFMDMSPTYKMPSSADINSGIVYFNYSKPLLVPYPSSEYNAWRAFMHSQNPIHTIRFIFRHWQKLKDSFPITSIWMDLNQYSLSTIRTLFMPSMLNSAETLAFCNAISKSMQHDIMYRKNK